MDAAPHEQVLQVAWHGQASGSSQLTLQWADLCVCRALAIASQEVLSFLLEFCMLLARFERKSQASLAARASPKQRMLGTSQSSGHPTTRSARLVGHRGSFWQLTPCFQDVTECLARNVVILVGVPAIPCRIFAEIANLACSLNFPKIGNIKNTPK